MKKLFIAALAVMSVSAFADYNNANAGYAAGASQWAPTQGRFATDRNTGAQCWVAPDGQQWFIGDQPPAQSQQWVEQYNYRSVNQPLGPDNIVEYGSNGYNTNINAGYNNGYNAGAYYNGYNGYGY